METGETQQRPEEEAGPIAQPGGLRKRLEEWWRFLWQWVGLAVIVPLLLVWLELWALRAVDVVQLDRLPLFALGLVLLGQLGPLVLLAVYVQGSLPLQQQPALFRLGLTWLVLLAVGFLGLLFRVSIPALIVVLVIVIIAVAAVLYLRRRSS